MEYVSTRGEAPALGFSDVLLMGLARDGGLYVPREWPQFSPQEIRALRGRSYADVAFAVMQPFVAGEIPDATLKRIIDESYATFRHNAVCPIVQTGPTEFVLELFHGPTLAFKDVAMQFLARIMDHLLSERGQRVTIVGPPPATREERRSTPLPDRAGQMSSFCFLMAACHPCSSAR